MKAKIMSALAIFMSISAITLSVIAFVGCNSKKKHRVF